MRLEKDLVKQVVNRLSVLNMTGEVEWFTRLNSGQVKTYFGNYIKLCDRGTPDFFAIIRNREDRLTALFIECKSDTGKLGKDQIEFIRRHGNKTDIIIMVLNDIKVFDKWVEKYAKNFVNLLPKDL